MSEMPRGKCQCARRNPDAAVLSQRLREAWNNPYVRYGAGVFALGGLAALLFSRRSSGLTTLVSVPSQAFPSSGYPGALVHIPSGYDAMAPLDLVVYFRGFNSCVSALAGSERARCRENGPLHKYSDLIGQFDRSGVNAILVMPELRVEESTGDPGQLGSSGGFARFLSDVLDRVVSPELGGSRTLSTVRRIVLCAHSGGYTATAAAISRGGVSNIDTACLFDAFYGDAPVFQRFAARAATEPVRFVSLYTGGGTEQNSVNLAQGLAGRLGGRLLFDPSSRAPTQEQWQFPVFVKRVSDEHSWIPLRYFEPFLRSCTLDER